MSNYKTPLLYWYQNNKRNLPFRNTKDPYAIYISEIMAQQTRIDQMLPYYERWMQKWPTIKDLANASEEEVINLWHGLGYYNRARKILQTAKIIASNYNGIFPDDYETILSLPGIGPYTAGAIGSIAYNLRTPAIDGNVQRILSRYYALDEEITTLSKEIYELVYSVMGTENTGIFTQALMECGALVCTPTSPDCLSCPLQDHCKALKQNNQEHYPIKKKKAPPKELEYYVYIILNKDTIALTNDDSDGLLKGFLRLPMYKEPINSGTYLFDSKHVFSHRIWKMHVYLLESTDIEFNYYPLDQIEQLPLAVAHQKIISRFF